MSNEKQESLVDVVAELRKQSNEERAFATELRSGDCDDVDFARACCYDEDAKYLSQIADRLEAATKREHDWSVKNALDLANTLANHGWTGEANADAASSCIFALCRMLKDVGNAAAMREGEKISAETRQRSADDSGCPNVLKNTTDIIAQSTPVGNAAAMREALVECANIGEQIDCQLGSSDETVYAFRHERCLAHNISECARAALAAPPRNCDLFNDVEGAWQAYKQFRDQTGEAVYFDMVHFWPFANWLFALAAERKGEGDEQK